MNPADRTFNFDLPRELIAQEPPAARGDSRLLLVQPGAGVKGELPFRALDSCLRPGDLLVLNQSKVLPARLQTTRQDTGGQVEILLIRPQADHSWLAMARPARRLRPGLRLRVDGVGRLSGQPDDGGRPVLEILDRLEDGQFLVGGQADPGLVAEQWGVMPLPPYIEQTLQGDRAHKQDARDRDRYQTVYARQDPTGAASVAAPTAGLHFSPDTLGRLEAGGVNVARLTLHVGPGTFKPPSAEQITARRLHREYFHLPAEVWAALEATRQAGGRVIAVGTTSLRVLETVARLGLDQAGPDTRHFGTLVGEADPVFTGTAARRGGGWDVEGQTRLFISPPEQVTAADGLLTNFHLPGSSLLMLVAALMGQDTWPSVYQHAVREKMRFYSYGDCMLIMPEAGDDNAR
jgi:S-adenosylmethionine:tRNA ribosyltransferase-isomerase